MKILFKIITDLPFGIDCANRELALALDKLGIDVFTFEKRGSFKGELEKICNREIPERVDWFFDIVGWIGFRRDYLKFYMKAKEEKKARIACLFVNEVKEEFEQPFCEEILPLLGKIDLMFSPSAYCAEMLKPRINAKVLPHGINPEIWNTEEPKTKIKVSGFKALWRGDVNDPRKNFECFAEAMENTGLTGVVLNHPCSNLMSNLRLLRGRKGVNWYISDEGWNFSQDKIADIVKQCDVYVNTSIGEGFGLMPLEAMACGVPVISPIHSGMKEYLNEKNCISIPFEKKRFHAFRSWPEAEWFFPETDELKKILLDLKRYDLKRIREAGLETAKEMTWEKVTKRFVEILRQ